MICINYLTLERLLCWTSVNGKLLKPAFIIKSYFEKDLRSVTTNAARYLTSIKTQEYPTPPSAKNKHWIYCLKAIKSEKFQDHPPPFCVGVINGWPLNSSWLWRANIWNNNHIHLFNTLSNFFVEKWKIIESVFMRNFPMFF